MAILDSLKNGFSNAVNTVGDVTQTIIERNRVNAQLNRLRSLMKSECEMINRAYITLGKHYYENMQNGKTDACENQEELFTIIEESKERIKKIRERYRQVIERQTYENAIKYDGSDLEDITVACSNEDEYGDSPFVAPTADDIVLQEVETPVDPEPQPVAPVQNPVVPEPQPVVPVQTPVIPEPQPVVPVQQPVIPEPQPVAPVQTPVVPEPQPVVPIQNPTIPNPQPVAPVQNPTINQPTEAAPKKADRDWSKIFDRSKFLNNLNNSETEEKDSF